MVTCRVDVFYPDVGVAACAWMVKAEYAHLFPHDPGTTAAAKALAAKTRELTLTRGVHGPREVHPVFAESPAAG